MGVGDSKQRQAWIVPGLLSSNAFYSSIYPIPSLPTQLAK